MRKNKEAKNRHSLLFLYERAKTAARARGHAADADDFASWLAIKYLEGKSQHQKIDYSLTDYLRQQYGSAGDRCGADAILRARRAPEKKVSGLDADSASKDAERVLAGICHAEWVDRELSLEYERHLDAGKYLGGENLVVFELVAAGMLEQDVAHAIGVSPSRISQILGEAKKEIRRFHALSDYRDRVMNGETCFEINWITI